MANKEIITGPQLGSWGIVVIPRTVTKQGVPMVLQTLCAVERLVLARINHHLLQLRSL
jgi:hypothetical protein